MLPNDYVIPTELSQQYLYDLLSCFAVQHSDYFDGFPERNVDAANKWFDAFWSYFITLSSPPVIHTDINLEVGSKVQGVKSALNLYFVTTFAAMNVAKTGQMVMFANCFTYFLTQVGLLFVDTYVTVPPAVPLTLGFEEVKILGMNGASGETCIMKLSEKLHSYATSFVSTQTVEPYEVFPWM